MSSLPSPSPAPDPSRSIWAEVSAGLKLDEAPTAPVAVSIRQRRRRGYDSAAEDGRATVELLRDDDGLLRWAYRPPPASLAASRRSYRSVAVTERQVVQRFRFNEFGQNELTQKLLGLDDWLTPGQGMKRWHGGRFIDDPLPVAGSGRVLLLVHGTFSNTDMWARELQATPEGQDLLAQWEARYDCILAFNHGTLSVGAWSNAIDLKRALRAVSAPIDVVCHSRGGLVVSWLLRLDAQAIERVVFVGAPLVGTSLAAPDKLRAALDLLANYADVVAAVSAQAGGVMPLAAGIAGLAKILGKALRLGSGLPLVDAAVGLVPGLATQQAVGNNLDLRQLFADEWACRPEMSGVGVSFQPDESAQPLWKFWKRFTHIGAQLKYSAADLVFPGPNDLVVDVNSMFRLGEAADIPFTDLGVSATTHHTNYFRNPQVLDCLRQRLG